jgi:hypothetical protein
VNEGVRVYSWDDVLGATGVLPLPVASADTDPVQQGTGWFQNTYAFAVDAPRGRVLFSGLDGRVRALGLETGEAATLLEVPGVPPVLELAIAIDATALALVADPGVFTRGRKRPAPAFQVWSLGRRMPAI